jgi:hypothetical protein
MPNLDWKRSCIYCTYMNIRITCKTVSNVYPQGTRLLRTDNVECQHVKF